MNRGTLKGFGESARSGKPIRIVRIASGSGIFRPLVPNSLCVVTVDGGGAGGGGGSNTTGGGGGGAGARVRKTLRLGGPVSYIVGAKGIGGAINTDGTDGSFTRFGTVVASGGNRGRGGGTGGAQGTGGDAASTAANAANDGATAGGGGGPGRGDAIQLSSSAPGFSTGTYQNGQALAGSGTKPGGAGGDSMRGAGGAGGNGGGAGSGAAGNSPSSTAYGGGGGGGGGGTVSGAVGGDGLGGYIEIEEYGL